MGARKYRGFELLIIVSSQWSGHLYYLCMLHYTAASYVNAHFYGLLRPMPLQLAAIFVVTFVRCWNMLRRVFRIFVNV